jgi:hypothetical protein
MRRTAFLAVAMTVASLLVSAGHASALTSPSTVGADASDYRNGSPTAACAAANAAAISNPSAATVIDQCAVSAPVPVQTRIAAWPNPQDARKVGMRLGALDVVTSPPLGCNSEALVVGVDPSNLTLLPTSAGLTVPLCGSDPGQDLRNAFRTVLRAQHAQSNGAAKPMVIVDTFTASTAGPTQGVAIAGVRSALGLLGVAPGTMPSTGADVTVVGQVGEDSTGAPSAVLPAGGAWLTTTPIGGYSVAPPANGTRVALPGNTAGYFALGADGAPSTSGTGTWSFQNPQQLSFDLRVNTDWNRNTITVGTQSFTQSWGGPDTFSVATNTQVGGFQLVVLDAHTLAPLRNAFYVTRGANTNNGTTWTEQPGLQRLAADLGPYVGQDVLIFLVGSNRPFASSVAGQLCRSTPANCARQGTGYAGDRTNLYDAALGVADQIRRLGGNPETFMSLAGTDSTTTSPNYSLVVSGITRANLAAQGISPSLLPLFDPAPSEAGGARTPQDPQADLAGVLVQNPDNLEWRAGPVGASPLGSAGVLNWPVPAIDQSSAVTQWSFPTGDGCNVPETTAGCNVDQLKAFEWFGEHLLQCSTYGCGLALRDLYRQSALPAALRLMVQCDTSPTGGPISCVNETDHGCALSNPYLPYPGGNFMSCAAYFAARQALGREFAQQAVVSSAYAMAHGDEGIGAASVTQALATAIPNSEAAISETLPRTLPNPFAAIDIGEAVGTGALLTVDSALVTAAAVAAELPVVGEVAEAAIGVAVAIWFAVWEAMTLTATLQVDNRTFKDPATGVNDYLAQRGNPSVLVESRLEAAQLNGQQFAAIAAAGSYGAFVIGPDSATKLKRRMDTAATVAAYGALLPHAFEVMDISNAPSPNIYTAGTYVGCGLPPGSPCTGFVDSSPGNGNAGCKTDWSPACHLVPYAVWDHLFWDFWQPPTGSTHLLAAESTIDTHSWSGGSTPNTVFTGNVLDLDPTKPNSYPAEDIAIGQKKMVDKDVKDTPVRFTAKPLSDTILNQIVADGGYLPDVYRQWGFDRHSCNAGNSQTNDYWFYPTNCYLQRVQTAASLKAVYNHNLFDQADHIPPFGRTYPDAGAASTASTG